MSEKKIKFSLETDIRQGKELSKFLTDLAAQGNKVAKSLSGMAQGAGASPGFQKGALAKSLLEQKALFKDLGKEGEKLAGILKNTIGRSSDELARKLRETTGQLKTMVNEHGRMERQLRTMTLTSGGSADEQAAIRSMQGKMGHVGGAIAAKTAQQQQLQAQQAALAGSGGGGGGPGTMGVLGNVMRGMGLSAGTLGVAGLAVLAGRMAAQLPQELITEKMDFMKGEARSAQALGSLGVSIRGGDLGSALAVHQLFGDSRKRGEVIKLAESRGLHTVANTIGKLGSADIYGALRAESMKDPQMKEELRQMIEYQRTVGGESQAQAQMFIGEAPGRVAAMRRLGGIDGIIGAGAKGWGMESEQSLGLAQGILDKAGRQAAHRMIGMAMGAVASGLTDQGATSIAAASAIGGKNLAAALVGRTFAGPSQIDTMTASSIAEAVNQSMMSTGGRTTGAGYMGMLAGFGYNGGPQDQVVFRENQAGMRALSGVFGGTHDPFQRSINLISAMDTLGSGSSIYSQNALASISDPRVMADMAAGNVPEELIGMGITSGQARTHARNVMKSLLRNRLVQDPGLVNSEAGGMAASIVNDYGGDYRSYFRDLANGSGLTGKKQVDFLNLKAQRFGGLFGQVLGLQPGEGAGALRDSLMMGAEMRGGGFTELAGGNDLSFVKMTAQEAQKRRHNIHGRTGFGNTSPTNMNATMEALARNAPGLANLFEALGQTNFDAEEAAKGLKRMNDQIERTKALTATGAVGNKATSQTNRK